MSTSAAYLGEVLPGPPLDGISKLEYCPDSDLLVAASWDKTVRVYEAGATQGVARAIIHHPAPVLDVAVEDSNTAFSACLDGRLRRLSLQTSQETYVGGHEAPIRCALFLRSQGLVASGSWDNSVRLWDPRAPPGHPQRVLPLPGKVFTMSNSQTHLVVGTSGRHVLIFDLRRLDPSPEQHRESSLKFQTRCVQCYPNGLGFALGSVEGRVAMEFFDQRPEAQTGKYAFKCHRRTEEASEVVFPVHSIVFNPAHGTFATGGGDGVINTWDGENKKRLFQISRYPTSVSALAYNRDGSLLAVASSYAHERGDMPGGQPPDSIYIRRMQDAEVRPKQKKV